MVAFLCIRNGTATLDHVPLCECEREESRILVVMMAPKTGFNELIFERALST